MLEYSVPTRCDRPAAVDLGERVTTAASRLGIAESVWDLGEIFRRTFARPASDPAYTRNWLQPGAMPLEWSFSEADPYALRIELQPFDPELSPQKRLRCAIAELLPIVERCHGKALAAQFEAAVNSNATEPYSFARFGASVGLVVRPDRTRDFKIYVETDPEYKEERDNLTCIPGAALHFRSIAVGAGVISKRNYYLCREGLRLLDLEPLCAVLGMQHRFPGLLLTMLELTGGEFYLPPQSAILSIRQTALFSELKVELISDLATDSEGLAGRVASLLNPAAIAPFRRWAEVVHPESPENVTINIVSIRITAEQPPCLSAYAAEKACEL